MHFTHLLAFMIGLLATIHGAWAMENETVAGEIYYAKHAARRLTVAVKHFNRNKDNSKSAVETLKKTAEVIGKETKEIEDATDQLTDSTKATPNCMTAVNEARSFARTSIKSMKKLQSVACDSTLYSTSSRTSIINALTMLNEAVAELYVGLNAACKSAIVGLALSGVPFQEAVSECTATFGRCEA